MRRSRQDLIRVGLFVLVAGAILVGGLLWIAGSRFFRPVDEYVVRFEESVSGLNPGANVEYQGVVVGRVRDVDLTRDLPPQVAVSIEVAPGTPVRADTRGELLGSLVTGIKFIQLHGGSASAPPVAPHGTIPGDVTSLDQFRDRLTEIADRAVGILRRFDEQVLTPDNTRQLSAFVTDLSAAAGSINVTLEKLHAAEAGEHFARLVRRLSEVADRLDVVLGGFQRRDFSGRVDLTLRHVDEVAVALRDLARATGEQVGGERASLGALIAELTATANRLQETLDVVRSDPSMLLWGRALPERELPR
jgi:phospholipid/cholesterol/gamma-HCH transport system substrate-binding protein